MTECRCPNETGATGTPGPTALPSFQEPIEQASQNDDEIIVTIGETIIHEFGHYFGLSEEEIEEIEERHWRQGHD